MLAYWLGLLFFGMSVWLCWYTLCSWLLWRLNRLFNVDIVLCLDSVVNQLEFTALVQVDSVRDVSERRLINEYLLLSWCWIFVSYFATTALAIFISRWINVRSWDEDDATALPLSDLQSFETILWALMMQLDWLLILLLYSWQIWRISCDFLSARKERISIFRQSEVRWRRQIIHLHLTAHLLWSLCVVVGTALATTCWRLIAAIHINSATVSLLKTAHSTVLVKAIIISASVAATREIAPLLVLAERFRVLPVLILLCGHRRSLVNRRSAGCIVSANWVMLLWRVALLAAIVVVAVFFLIDLAILLRCHELGSLNYCLLLLLLLLLLMITLVTLSLKDVQLLWRCLQMHFRRL